MPALNFDILRRRRGLWDQVDLGFVPKVRMRFFQFLPATMAIATDLVTTFVVLSLPQSYPSRVVLYQIIMFGLALLLATPSPWVWFASLVLLVGGVMLAGFSIGMFYIPTVVAAGWVMVWRLDRLPVDGGQGA